MAPTVLIVDDDAGMRELLRLKLADEFEIATSANGRECLEYLDREPLPALVLLDVMMPHMDGFEVLDRLRSEVAPDLPVVLLTAAETEERVDDTIDVADRIEKPFRVAEVVDCVRRVLGEPAAD